jgi:curved DNA-binding protein
MLRFAAMAAEDMYATLGVPKTASAAEVKKAYRKLARELHPDRNAGDKVKEERFKRVSSAYDVLSDPKKRALYDQYGTEGLREGFDPAAYEAFRNRGGGFGGGGGGFDPSDLFGGGGQGGIPFDLGDLFGGRGRRSAGPRPGQDFEAVASIDFRESVLGTERELRSAGSEATVRVRIPPGSRSGSKLRVRGKGGPGQRGGPAGDLLLTIEVEEHPSFYFVEGDDDLHVRLPVKVSEAYLGARVEVPTPVGSVQVKIPPGTDQGAKLRLREKGVPRKEGKASDLIVHIEIRMPKAQTPEMVAAFERIAEDTAAEDVRAALKF